MARRRNALNRLSRLLGPGLGRLQERATPAARLARIDLVLMRSWLRNVTPVGEALGAEEAAAYTRLVVSAATRDVATGRLLANILPDHLARVSPGQRRRYVGLLDAVMADKLDAAPLVTRTLPDLLDRMEDHSLARYLARALELFADSPQKAESFLKVESREGQVEATELRVGLVLEDVKRVLAHYARAHCGADVAIRTGGADAFTDGRNIYLPDLVDRFGDERDFLVYRVLTARNAGYLEFGSLDLDLDLLPGTWADRREGELEHERLLRSFLNPALARDLFSRIEQARVEHHVRQEYPGVARDMDRVAEWLSADPTEREAREPRTDVERAVALFFEGVRGQAPGGAGPVEDAVRSALSGVAGVRRPGTTVTDSVAALCRAYPSFDALMRKVQDRPDDGPEPDDAGPRDAPPRGEGAAESPAGPDPDYRSPEPDPLAGDLRTGAMDAGERELEARTLDLLQAARASGEHMSLGDARDAARREGSTYEEMADFLDRMQAPAGPARELVEQATDDIAGDTGSSADGTDVEARGGTWTYPEWDAGIQDHKPNWVRVTEYVLQPGALDFVERVRADYGSLISQIRRSFEALRPESLSRVRGLADGDEIDLDRAVAARVERRAGGSPSDRIYMRHQRDQRDVAVAFLVDMSSSTNEVVNAEAKRVIEVEKEALVLISEAVDAIGDSFAIFGFSGYGRDQVAFYIAKDFADRWDEDVRRRVGRVSWKMENRDGAAIRHATSKLAAWPARVKLLILLSDGKPLDCGCDHYADQYAQEDTRLALREARAAGVHPFCITVDPAGAHYLPQMYGEVGYTVIDRVDSLPVRLPMIYRRLTR